MPTDLSRCPLYLLNSSSKNPDGGSLVEPEKGSVYGSYLYWNADSASGKWVNEPSTVHLGINAGRFFQGGSAIALGAYAGQSNQGANAVAIGLQSGAGSQGANAVAIGERSGYNNQGSSSVAIGQLAGSSNQNRDAIAIGPQAAETRQGTYAVAIGQLAGNLDQSRGAIAIGNEAGLDYQGINSIAIGNGAGEYAQGNNSIAIGFQAGKYIQPANSIILNASASPLDVSLNTGFYVRPVNGPRSSSNVLSYDTLTGEIYYNGSSERYKYDIAPLSKDTSVVYNLQPREFKYKLSDEPDIGLIAEEAFECDSAFAYLDKDQIPEGIQWNVVTTYLVAELKKLKREIDELEKGIV
jgi:hypothetical protein